MPDQLEVRPAQQVGDVRLLAGEEVVEADHVVPLVDQPLAQVRAQKPGPAGDQNAFDLRHGIRLSLERREKSALLLCLTNRPIMRDICIEFHRLKSRTLAAKCPGESKQRIDIPSAVDDANDFQESVDTRKKIT